MQRTITRRAIAAFDGLGEEFGKVYNRNDLNRMMELLKESDIDERPSMMRAVFSMLDDLDISYEKGMPVAYYEDLVKEAAIPSFEESEAGFLSALNKLYKEYPSPEEYMKRIVDRLSSDDDGWSDDTLRVRILKQFVKYGNSLRDAGFGGKNTVFNYVRDKYNVKAAEETVLELLDDGVFDVLVNAKKEQKKPRGTYGLLRAADDLASGKFRGEGATKRNLYLFAMVYGMTYKDTDDSGQIRDYDSDIEINLFHDYYVNNLLQYISEDYRNGICEYETDPSGLGINYKNYAEMVFLYYISSDHSPSEKIRLSYEMIDRLKGSVHEDHDEGIGRTAALRNGISENRIFTMDPEDFEKYIRENYDCNTDAGDHEIGVLQLENDQNTAFVLYNGILDHLKTKTVLADCDYGLWFTDTDSPVPGTEHESGDLMEVLRATDGFMKGRKRDGIPWMLSVKSPSEMTRTALLTAFYYDYNISNEDKHFSEGKTFNEIFNDIKVKADPMLEASGYQPVSGRNLFDVLLAFSSYAYINY